MSCRGFHNIVFSASCDDQLGSRFNAFDGTRTPSLVKACFAFDLDFQTTALAAHVPEHSNRPQNGFEPILSERL